MTGIDTTLLEFPCQYTIKVLGRAEDDFMYWVQAQVEQHAGPCSHVEQRPSKEGRFVSVNATFTAQSLEQLQAIHQQLKASKRVSLML